LRAQPGEGAQHLIQCAGGRTGEHAIARHAQDADPLAIQARSAFQRGEGAGGRTRQRMWVGIMRMERNFNAIF